MLWVYLYFPSLQLDGLTEPFHSSNKALVLVDSRNNEIVQLNALAQQSGIRKGMGLATAAALNHHLLVLPYSAEKEKLKLKQVAKHLYQVSSDVAFDHSNGLYLRMENMLALYGSIKAYWQVVQKTLSSLKITFHYGCALNPSSAKILAVAKVDQLLYQAKEIECVLHQQSINLLAITQKQKQHLSRIGIKTIGQLMQIPMRDLIQRFDKSFTHYITQLCDTVNTPMDFYQPKEFFSQYIELLYDISHVTKLHEPIHNLLEKLEAFLCRKGVASQLLKLHFFLRNAQCVIVEVSSVEAIYKAEKWLTLLTLKLESLVVTAPITALKLECKQLINNQPQIKDIFNDVVAGDNQHHLLSLLTAKVGEPNVKRIVIRDDHCPEQANTFTTFDSSYCSGKGLQLVDIPKQHLLRPSYLLNQPEPLTEKITVISPPERIETAWWHVPIKRDYFVGKNSEGQILWLFRQPDNQWYVHGYFA